MGLLDKMIETVSPQMALKREASRMKLRLARSFTDSGYDESGASRTKNSMKGWLARSLTPQEPRRSTASRPLPPRTALI